MARNIHWGYGFRSAASRRDAEHAPSPPARRLRHQLRRAGVTTSLEEETVRASLHAVTAQLYRDIPTGVGSSTPSRASPAPSCTTLLTQGARWAVKRGFAARPTTRSAARRAAGSRAPTRAPSASGARLRGSDQLGTLGSGNHFLEVDRVAEIYDPAPRRRSARAREGGAPDPLRISRGLGYQVCDEFLAELTPRLASFGPTTRRCRTGSSPARRRRARRGGATSARCRRRPTSRGRTGQVMTGLAVRALLHALRISERDLGARVLYDVCHNVAKHEEHEVDGVRRRVIVHRKGCDRAFAPAIRGSPRRTAPSDSPSSSRETWGATPTCSPGRTRR